MRSIFTDTAPVAEVRGGLVVLTFEGELHPCVTVPVHVARKFCEVTKLEIDEWEAEQRARGIEQLRARK